MTFYFSFRASETDIMACDVCRIIHERCVDNCCFKKYFGPQDVEKFQKIRKNNHSVKFMRATLSDDDISDEHKKGLIERWYVCRDTCLFADLFPPGAKEIIVEIINEQGMEMVKTEVKLMLEKLSKKTDDEEKLAAQILLDLNQGDQQ